MGAVGIFRLEVQGPQQRGYGTSEELIQDVRKPKLFRHKDAVTLFFAAL